MPSQWLAWGSLGYVLLFYLVGIALHATRTAFRFTRDGALQGKGYLPYFRRARRSLLLMHVDDDPPGAELLGLYRELLDRGVEIRRVLLLRADQAGNAGEWVLRFGEHERLQHRIILPNPVDVMRLSFAVVDERWVIVSIPGDAAVDGEVYSERFVLRHLLALEGEEIAEAFTEVHAQLWTRGTALESEELLLNESNHAPRCPKPGFRSRSSME